MNHLNIYVDFLKPKISPAKKLKVVFDASNGAAGFISEKVFSNHDMIEPIFINTNPDPDFSAHGPNPIADGASDQIKKTIIENKADFGVMYDADGDRAVFVSETGEVIPSYAISLLLFRNAGTGPYIADTTVYQTLSRISQFAPGELYQTKVGMIFVKEAMRNHNASVGAEYSGHYYFSDVYRADSGIYSTIVIINEVSKMPSTLGEFYKSLPTHKVSLESFSIREGSWPEIERKITDHYSALGASIEKLDGVTVGWPDKWVNVRPSNTEPLLRITVGCSNENETEKLTKEFKSFTV